MVRDLSAQGITHAGVLAAMGDIPRERFVAEALHGEAYGDFPLPIGRQQTISQPWIVARMSELLEPDGSGAALEIGSGSGYHAAVLARLFERVYSIERIPELSWSARATLRELGIDNVHFKIFDGSYGWSEFCPYDAILVTAAVPEVPAPLIAQLRDGGRMVLPLAGPAGRQEQVLTRIVKHGERLEREEHGACRFVPLVGRFGWSQT
jgi:protein-L-isoaspartate(D-aspartate) O-methyltransferase